MKQLFLKSNILHIRTNEGEFEVSPECYTKGISRDGENYWYNIDTGTTTVGIGEKERFEWPGGVELIESCIKGSCAEANECIQPHYCVAKKLARLIPEEAESAYKEFEGKYLDNFTPSPEQQQRAQFVDWIVLDKLAPDQLFTKVWNTHVVPLGLKNANLEDWNRELIEKLKASESEKKALNEENLRLQNRVSSLENICEMDRKTEYQYNQGELDGN